MKLYLHGGKLNFFKSPALALVQFGTDSPYFHVDIEYEKNLVIGSLFWTGVTVRTLDQIKNECPPNQYIDIYECLENVDQKLCYDFLTSKIGHHYDRIGLFYLAWLKIIRDRESANKFQKEKDYFCSELAVAALRIGGAKFTDIPADSVASPADIARSKHFVKIGPL